MRMRDELGPSYADHDFAALFPRRGQPAASPARLALVTFMQFAAGRSDRPAAAAVRRRIDWKYALGLELTNPGFDASVRAEFRTRLLRGKPEQVLFAKRLARLRERQLLKARGRMRTDSTHVLAAGRSRNRLEFSGETLYHALHTLASVAPAWLRSWVPSAWFDRYGRHFEEYRLPPGRAERYSMAAQIAADGAQLLAAIDGSAAPAWLREVPAVQTLRQIWEQQFVLVDDKLEWREAEDWPPSAELIHSPYDVAARYSKKRQTEWNGYKVHLTATCDDDLPHLITAVETTIATVTDYEMTEMVHNPLAQRELGPREHLVDSGYMSAEQLVASDQHGIDLVGPVTEETSWQARAADAYDITAFAIDWEQQQARCPQGHLREKGRVDSRSSAPIVNIRCPRAACRNCPVREKCTRAVATPRRALTVYAQPLFSALQAARAQQRQEGFRQRYDRRAGIEGTISQAVGSLDMRRSRFIGLVKTHLQHICVALGVNVLRVGAWLDEDFKPHRTHKSAFAALASAGA